MSKTSQHHISTELLARRPLLVRLKENGRQSFQRSGCFSIKLDVFCNVKVCNLICIIFNKKMNVMPHRWLKTVCSVSDAPFSCLCLQVTDAAVTLCTPVGTSLSPRPCQAISYKWLWFYSLYIHMPTTEKGLCSRFDQSFYFLVFWLHRIYQLSDLWAWAIPTWRKKMLVTMIFTVNQSQKSITTALHLDSDIKPDGCRRCILGSCTLVFVWEGVPAWRGDFFFL